MLKKSNKKVEELHQELQELNAHIVVKDPEELLGNNTKHYIRAATDDLVNINQVVEISQCSALLYISITRHCCSWVSVCVYI